MSRSLSVRCAAALALVVVVAGCGSSSGTGPGGRTACNPPLSIGPTTFSPATGTINVTYTASVTGDGQISTLTYQGASGPVVVNGPTLPFSVSTTVPLPSQAQMTASGSYNTNGTASIAYNANLGGGNIQQGNQSCGTSN